MIIFQMVQKICYFLTSSKLIFEAMLLVKWLNQWVSASLATLQNLDEAILKWNLHRPCRNMSRIKKRKMSKTIQWIDANKNIQLNERRKLEPWVWAFQKLVKRGFHKKISWIHFSWKLGWGGVRLIGYCKYFKVS